jgi:hypothetical protein
MRSDSEIIESVEAAFGSLTKPEHFTDYTHCPECLEHDEILRMHDRDTLRLEHVDNPGWDPLCFCSPAGKAYYMPALVRFALAPPRYEFDSYWDQLLFHLAGDGPGNDLILYCNAEQRRAIADFLAHVLESRTEQVVDSNEEAPLLAAFGYWSVEA